MENLQPELKLEVFSRLPAESILECKLVCKTWLRLLMNDPCFAQMHLRRRLVTLPQLHDVPNEEEEFSQSQTNSGDFELGFIYLKYVEVNQRSGNQLWYGKHDDDDEHSFRTVKRINHPYITEGPNRGNQWNLVIGSCNGLICCSIPHHGIEDPIYIYNPITREFVNLPRFVIRGKSYWSKNHNMVGGFGYSPSTNEYKVVRIFYPNGHQEPELGRVQVYTLGGGNGWRDKGEITYSISLGQRGILVNEELHWLVNNDKLKIVAFNLALEEFHFIDSPPIVDDRRSDWNCIYHRLCVLGRWLCLSHYVPIRGRSHVDMWLLKKKTSRTGYDDDMNEQMEYHRGVWIKEFTIRTTYDYSIYPLGLTNRGEILFMKSRFLWVYDLKTATLGQPEELDDNCCCKTAIPHINTFVSLKALGEKCRRRKKNYV